MASLTRKLTLLEYFFRNCAAVNTLRLVSTSYGLNRLNANERIRRNKDQPLPKVVKQRDNLTVLRVLAGTQTQELAGVPELGLIDDEFYLPQNARWKNNMLQAQQEGEKVADGFLKRFDEAGKLPLRKPVPAWPSENELTDKTEKLKYWIETGQGGAEKIVKLYKDLCEENPKSIPLWVQNLMLDYTGYHLLNGDCKESKNTPGRSIVSLDTSENGDQVHTLSVGTTYIRFLVGKDQVKLRKLQEETGCRIEIDQAGNQSTILVKITGSTEQTKHCLSDIDRLFEWVHDNTDIEKESVNWGSHLLVEQIFDSIGEQADANTYEVYIMLLIKHGQLQKASQIFDEMKNKNFKGSRHMYNTLIANVKDPKYNRGYMQEIQAITQTMKAFQMEPDLETFHSIMCVVSADSSGTALETAQKIIGEMKALNIDPTVETLIYLLKPYTNVYGAKRQLVSPILEAISNGTVRLNEQPHNDSILFHSLLMLPGLWEPDAERVLNVMQVYVSDMSRIDSTIFEAYLRSGFRGPIGRMYSHVVPKLLTPSRELLRDIISECRVENNKNLYFFYQEYKKFGYVFDSEITSKVLDSVQLCSSEQETNRCLQMTKLALDDIKSSGQRFPEDIASLVISHSSLEQDISLIQQYLNMGEVSDKNESLP